MSQRGISLEKDFKRLFNDEEYSDIIIKCSDGVTVFGCKVILTTRSDLFNELINYGNKDTLSFKNIDSNAMKIILAYLYTPKAEKNLTVKNIIEVYHASVHFKLVKLQKVIIDHTMKFLKDGDKNIGKELLTQYVNKFNESHLQMDTEMSQVLVDWIAKDKLLVEESKKENNSLSLGELIRFLNSSNTTRKYSANKTIGIKKENDSLSLKELERFLKKTKKENDSLSLEGLKYFLKKTINTKKPFATPEINLWKYSLIKAKDEFLNNQSIEKVSGENSTVTRREFEEIKKRLTPFIDCIELNRMDAKEIKDFVEPLNIYSVEGVKDVYYLKTQDKGLEFIRGAPIFRWKVNDYRLSVSDDGFTIRTTSMFTAHKSILGNLIFKGDGTYEWDISILKLCGNIYIGVCDIFEDLSNTDQKYHGWVLGSDGYVYHKNNWKWYDAKFKEGDKVTVHLNMKMRTCAFSVNNNKKSIVSDWEVPSEVYPIVSLLKHNSKLRIEPHIT